MDKKIAIVTGSKRGIGLATGKILAGNGFRVIFSDISDLSEIGSFADELAALPNECYYIKCDISNEADRKRLFASVIEREERIDVLVNNAGVAPLERRDLLETTEESFDRVLRINLKGTFFMCQQAARTMLACKAKLDESYHPRIINIASMSAYTSSPNRPEYCISKAGIAMVTSLFADRLAEEGIPVFEIRPGIILTDMTQVVKEKYEKLIAEGVTPIKRFGRPEDVGSMVLAACTGLLDFTTGQVLNADGGFHLRRL